MGTDIPIISAEDLIICKAAYNRAQDWIDIENMFRVQRQNLDQQYLRRWLNEFFPPEDERVQKLNDYIGTYVASRDEEGR